MSQEPKPKTKLGQFSVAHMLILLSALCVLLAFLTFLNSYLTPAILIMVVGASLPLAGLLFIVAVYEIKRLRISERMGLFVFILFWVSVLAWPPVWFLIVAISQELLGVPPH